MRELVILSGKGGAGKTSLTASFVALAGQCAIADCDVDGADLHLLLHPVVQLSEDYYCGWQPVIDEECCGCGRCVMVCRFGAMHMEGLRAEVDLLSCEGCGVCADQCFEEAITLEERLSGTLYASQTAYGPLVHARLGVGGANSGKLVSEVKKRARRAAVESGQDLVFVDGPPGVGCPAIAAVTGASNALLVAEPTVSGFHDVQRALELCEHFRVPAGLCVNKACLNPDIVRDVRRYAERKGAPFLGEIRVDSAVTAAQIAGRPVVEEPGAAVAKDILGVWEAWRRCWDTAALAAVD